ncbi:hypothetical protein [Bacillus phage SBSphiJ2]|nr:hypothetical protein [Bacillus phage SBSphiJ2]
MASIFLAIGSVGVICAAGTGITAAFKWFHCYEPEFTNKKSTKNQRGGNHNDRIENLSKRINPRSEVR